MIQMKGWIVPIIAIAIFYFLMTMYLGVTGGIVAILLSVGLVLGLGWAGVINTRALVPKKMTAILAVVIIGAGLFTGGYLGEFLQIPGTVGGGVPPATVEAPPASPDSATCNVAESLLDETITVNFVVYDEAGGSRSDVTALVELETVYSKADGSDNGIASALTNGTTDLSTNAGSVLNIYGNSTAYYVIPKKGICVNQKQMTVELTAYRRASESDMSVTVYDSKNNELTAGNVEDYNLTLGANGEEILYAELEMNAADDVYWYGGFATFTGKNISSYEPLSDTSESGSSGTYTAMPQIDYLEDITLQCNGSASTPTISEDFDAYKRNEPVALTEWMTVTVKTKVTASSSDPEGVGDSLDTGQCSDSAYFGGFFLDADAEKHGDGSGWSVDIYTHTEDDQNNVGLAETLTSPQGKQVGFIIAAD